jgi:arsenite methyltransferase
MDTVPGAQKLKKESLDKEVNISEYRKSTIYVCQGGIMNSRDEEVRNMVKKRYSQIAQSGNSCCSSECCGGQSTPFQIMDMAQKVGYTNEQLTIGLGQANLGLGCGNPIALADLKPGEKVIDLGSGAGFDAFLAAKTVGPAGKVIGIDMTPEMISKAQKNGAQLDLENVEFRLGEIEHLPVEDNSADVVLSNCVINLSPNKRAVYGEIFRILKPGGRISISDVLRLADIPKDLKDDPAAHTG